MRVVAALTILLFTHAVGAQNTWWDSFTPDGAKREQAPSCSNLNQPIGDRPDEYPSGVGRSNWTVFPGDAWHVQNSIGLRDVNGTLTPFERCEGMKLVDVYGVRGVSWQLRSPVTGDIITDPLPYTAATVLSGFVIEFLAGPLSSGDFILRVAGTNNVDTAPAGRQGGAVDYIVASQLPVPPPPPSPPSVELEPGPGAGEVTVTVTDDANGFASTSFSASLASGSGTCTVSSVSGSPATGSCVISGLDNGISVQAQATGSNVGGTSGLSALSDAVETFAPPAAPTNLTVGDVVVDNDDLSLDGTVTIEWDAPTADGGTPVTTYSVVVTYAGGTLDCALDDPATEGDVPTSCTLTAPPAALGLDISITVEAENIVGSGAPLTGSSVFTRVPYAPSAVAADAGADGAAPDTISVALTSGPDGGSDILNYEYSLDDGDSFVALAPAQATSPLTIGGLTPNTEYDIVIRAVNALGVGAASSPATVLTRPGAPAPDEGVSVFVALDLVDSPLDGIKSGDGSITITWSEPDDDGEDDALTYTVYRVVRGVAVTPPVCVSTSTSCDVAVSDLDLTDTYVFEVTASNTSGEGPASDPSSPYLAIARADAPTDVDAALSTVVGDVLVTWSAPVVTNASAVTEYRIVAESQGNGSAGSCTLSTLSGPLACIVQGLSVEEPWDNTNGGPNPATTLDATYDFTVYAINGAGASLAQVAGTLNPPATIIVQGTPNPPVFELAGSELERLLVDDSSAFVAFVAGEPRGVPVEKFEFELRDANGDPVVAWTDVTGERGELIVPSDSDVGVALVPSLFYPDITASALRNGDTYALWMRAVNEVPLASDEVLVATFTPQATPSRPQSVNVIPGDSQALVSWTAPERLGSEPLSYVVRAYRVDDQASATDPFALDRTVYASCTVASPVTSCLITSGLENGVEYEFVVAAALASTPSEFGRASEPAVRAIPRTAPEAPTGVTGAPGDRQVAVSWDAVLAPRDGGFPVLEYWVTAAPGGASCIAIAPATTCTVTGLTNGTPYTFTVVGFNEEAGDPSAASAPVTPRTVPDAPTGASGVPDDGSVTVSWTAPAIDGGAPVTEYRVTANPGGATCTASAPSLTCTVTGLVNGSSYTFAVEARNEAGFGSASSPSEALTPRRLASAPTDVAGVVGDRQIRVSWSAPSELGTGGVRSYEARAVAGEASFSCSANSTSTSCLITGLANGTQYAITVVAIGDYGPGSASAPLQLTPRAVPGAPSQPQLRYVVGDASLATAAWPEVGPDADGGQPVLIYEAEVYAFIAEAVAGTALDSCSVNVSDVGVSTASTDGEADVTCGVTGLVRGDSYVVRVRARNVAGLGAWSVYSEPFIAGVTPSAPSIVTLTSGDGTGTLTFDAPSDDGGIPISGYDISLDGGASWQIVATDSPVTLSGLTNGVLYTVSLRAVNAAGPGPASDTATLLPLSAIVGVPTDVLGLPDDGEAWLLFTPVPGAVGYEISVDDGAWTASDSSAVPVQVPELDNDTEYCVRVRAVGIEGPGEASELVCVTPTADANAVPDTALAVEAPERALEVTAVDGNGELSFDFVLNNTGASRLGDVWLQPLDLPDGTEVVDLVPEAGRGTITRFDSNWYWQGVNLDVGASATVRITIRLEVK